MPGFRYTPVHFTFPAQPLGNATILPVTLARWVPMSAGATWDLHSMQKVWGLLIPHLQHDKTSEGCACQ